MDFQTVINDLLGVVVLALTSIVTVTVPLLALYLKKKWGLEVDEKQRTQLTNAINNGINYAAKMALDPSKETTVRITKAYVESNAPDALAHFGGGVDSPQLEKKIISQISPPTTAGAVAMIVPTPDEKAKP